MFAQTSSVRAEEDDLEARVERMEGQLRQLMGQVEELTFEVKQLRADRKTGEYEPAPQKKRKLALDESGAAQGIEQVDDGSFEEQPLTATVLDDDGNEVQVPIKKAPGPKILGTLSGSSYEGDGGFQGKVLVPEGGGGGNAERGSYDNGGQVLVAPSGTGSGSEEGNTLVPEKVETAALGDSATNDPEVLYERSYESLLRRRFTDAEVGFRGFVTNYRDHSLAGNAQYWLGETFYVQGDYKQAAQAFLTGYRDYPKSRKAADSLLKLGLSLNRLGQKEQACAAFSQVGSQFPKAAEARKRAQVESRRGGC